MNLNLNNFPGRHDDEDTFIDKTLLIENKMNPKEPQNNYTETTDEFSTQYLRYKLHMDKRGFEAFDLIQAQILCEKKDIILHHKRNLKETLEQRFIDLAKPYKSPKVIMINLSKKMTLKNLNTGIDKFNKGIDSFMKVIEPTTKQKDLSIPDIKIPNFKEISSLVSSPKKEKAFKLHNEKELKKLLGR